MIIKTLVVLLASMSLTTALIVCTPEFCNLVDCQHIPQEMCEKEGNEYRPKSSECGCCDQCIKYLDICEPCSERRTLPHVRGGPPPLKKHCRPGLSCQKGRCRRVKTSRS